MHLCKGRRGDFRLPPQLIAARCRPSPSLSPNLEQRHRAPYTPAATPRRRLPLVPPRPLRQGARPRVRVLVRALVRVRVLYCPFACEASSQPRRATRTAHSSGLISPHGHPPLSPLPPSRGVGERTRAYRALSLGRQPRPCLVSARSTCSSSCILVELLWAQTICASDALRGQHSANLLSARGGGKCTVKPHYSGHRAARFIYTQESHSKRTGKPDPEVSVRP